VPQENKRSLDEIDAEGERIAVVGSPSSTSEMRLDILGTAADKRIVGAFTYFVYQQDGFKHCALGQVTDVKLTNVWAQDPTMRGLIRQKGRVDPITERQDTHVATMSPGAVFVQNEDTFDQSILGTVPPTGTSVKLVTGELLDMLLADYQEELLYLGRIYGTQTLLPMWFRHFGRGNGGAGEAYHLGVFGKTGSGKSVLARMILLAYAQHEAMSILVIDPQGEFAKTLAPETPIGRVLREVLGRTVRTHRACDLVLYHWPLFWRFLTATRFFTKLEIYRPENIENATMQFKDLLRGLDTWDLASEDAFDRVWNGLTQDDILRRIFSGVLYQDRLRNARMTLDRNEMLDMWMAVAQLFTRSNRPQPVTTRDICERLTEEGGEASIVILDVSEADAPEGIAWTDEIQSIVIRTLIQELKQAGLNEYRNDRLQNLLVIIDEAHRFAPREHVESEVLMELRGELVDAILTTRKYGLGWAFISQTLGSLHRDIINQMRIYFFGYGLQWGNELRALRGLLGGMVEPLNLYQSFQDPESALRVRRYPFMAMGPVSPLSFAGYPLFFNALSCPNEDPNEYLEVNFHE